MSSWYWIDEEGHPKVTDFGLARIVDEHSLSAHHGLLGTYFYMSPEQAAAKTIGIDHRTDVFSLGVVLYEMLTLRRPFEGDTQTQILEQILYQDPEPPKRVRSRVPLDLSIICMKALEKQRDQRYATMTELAADLRRFLANEPILARPPGPLRRAQKWVLRHPARSASLTVGVVASLVVLGLLGVILRTNMDLKTTIQDLTQARNDLSTTNEQLTTRNEELTEARQTSDLRNENFLATANIKKLADLLSEEKELWPARSVLLPRIEDWLARAQILLAARPEVDAVLARLEAGAEAGSDGEAPGQETGTAASSERFEDEADAWLYEQLLTLQQGLDSFAQHQVPSVEARRTRATTIEAETLDRYAGEWSDAILAILDSDLYGGLDLPDQVGLVPLGPNEHGYWEFWHVESGERPERDEDTGRLSISGETGIVLVLVPGGTFWMGSQKDNPDGPNYDRDHKNDELLHEVTLDAYFISKYELTQGQWERIMGPGSNPSNYGAFHDLAGDSWARHPVEQVSWEDCDRALHRVGLVLPTEARWERATRAGTDTARWCAADSLASAAHLVDHAYKRGLTSAMLPEDWDDGFPAHAPVGTFAGNGFGLYDVYGNVWEWCSDWYGSYESGHREGDGALAVPFEIGFRFRVFRGGSFNTPAVTARSADRDLILHASHYDALGCRPAKGITTD